MGAFLSRPNKYKKQSNQSVMWNKKNHKKISPESCCNNTRDPEELATKASTTVQSSSHEILPTLITPLPEVVQEKTSPSSVETHDRQRIVTCLELNKENSFTIINIYPKKPSPHIETLNGLYAFCLILTMAEKQYLVVHQIDC